MPKSTDKNSIPDMPGTNPSVNPQTGAINPSAPTVGTEGWGNTSDERHVLATNDPAATRTGQMKGKPGDKKAEATRLASERPTSNKRRENAPGNDQADLSRRTSGSAYSLNTSGAAADHAFRCADVGNADCRWETSGSTGDEVLRRAEEHGRRDHGMTDWTEAMRTKVRDHTHRREAA